MIYYDNDRRHIDGSWFTTVASHSLNVQMVDAYTITKTCLYCRSEIQMFPASEKCPNCGASEFKIPKTVGG